MHHSEFIFSRSALKKYRAIKELIRFDHDPFKARTTTLVSLANKINLKTGEIITPVELYAYGSMLELQRQLIDQLQHESRFPVDTIHKQILDEIGADSLQELLGQYLEEYPIRGISIKKYRRENYLLEIDNQYGLLIDIYLLHLAEQNPASKKIVDLIQVTALTENPNFKIVVSKISNEANKRKKFGNSPTRTSIKAIFNKVISQSPDSFTDQLVYMLEKYGDAFGKDTKSNILNEINEIKKTMLYSLDDGNQHDLPEMTFPENNQGTTHYRNDEVWMKEMVLIAKNCYVWLDQLSRQYQKPIHTLDQVPDEELDRLTEAGISGLWLIGLWERSIASKKIKQLMGNKQAVASAYSLMDYKISKDLGGQKSLSHLKERAGKRGIRLMADMVPNHMGIDSHWVNEYPDRFLSLKESPFQKYTFTGMDLSDDKNTSIMIEDHYYDRSDAAVVFKRIDHRNGDVRYIYHGNDGTAMPWNDTAQLDYLKPEVREAVIQVILKVARKFPIIRFDAAMTLANEHIKRLWYPTHGVGGAIPSRYDHEMTIEEFNKLMPKEFWREVVDRVEKDVPGTLLLAEAFWLMEGYFVRTLGMHRVYNSAFMHMLRDEDNDKYRTLIKNVLEYDPQILQRFVNFMNNPDEKPAVEQFGKGDKYLGVCTLMVSMPGLPMFGHGQIEGYREKYGMEYKKADLDETPDEGLLKAHEWHIFPLLKQREIFASIKNFVLYDFMNKDGTVDENVIVYSNCLEAKNKEGENRYSLIVYHNKNTHSNGYIKDAAGIGSKGNSSHVNLGKALNLNKSDRQFIIYRDLENNLEYIRSSKRIMDKGLFLRLKGYQHHAFLNFRTVEDSDGKWKKVNNDLKGKGYWSIKARYDEMFSSSKKNKRD